MAEKGQFACLDPRQGSRLLELKASSWTEATGRGWVVSWCWIDIHTLLNMQLSITIIPVLFYQINLPHWNSISNWTPWWELTQPPIHKTENGAVKNNEIYIYNVQCAVYTHKMWLLTMTFIFLRRVSPFCGNPRGLVLIFVLDCYFPSYSDTKFYSVFL